MYAAYAVAFLIAIMAFADLTPEMRASEEAGRGSAVALHMGAWHQAAVKRCRAVACPAGVVDPSSHLPSTLPASAYSARFRTVSSGSGLIVTFFRAPAGDESGERAALMTGLSRHFSGNLGVGVYNASAQKVFGMGSEDNAVDVPNVVGGVTIPNGAPVMARQI